MFDNEPQALSDRSGEVIERQIEQTLPSTPGRGAAAARPSRTDQVCVYSEVTRDATHRRLISIIGYNPPHKLTLANLRAGLHPMSLREDVIDRVAIPASTDVVANSEYQFDRLVAAAVTQLYLVHDPRWRAIRIYCYRPSLRLPTKPGGGVPFRQSGGRCRGPDGRLP